MASSDNTSDAYISGLNVTLEPLESLILKGIQQKFQNLTGAKTIWTSSSDKTLTLQQLFGNPSSTTNDVTITYPYIFLTVNSVSESETRLHNRTSSMRGYPSVITDDQKRAYNVKFLALDTAVGIQFVTNSYKQVLRFANLWMFARRDGWLKFDVAYGRTHFGVHVDMENSLSLPQREADPEDVSEYVVEGNFTIHGFMSFATLIEQQVANRVEYDFQLPEATTFWSFISPNDTDAVTGSGVEPQHL